MVYSSVYSPVMTDDDVIFPGNSPIISPQSPNNKSGNGDVNSHILLPQFQSPNNQGGNVDVLNSFVNSPDVTVNSLSI